jgi:hypothetical protein
MTRLQQMADKNALAARLAVTALLGWYDGGSDWLDMTTAAARAFLSSENRSADITLRAPAASPARRGAV